jgi:hypothetical protein
LKTTDRCEYGQGKRFHKLRPTPEDESSSPPSL